MILTIVISVHIWAWIMLKVGLKITEFNTVDLKVLMPFLPVVYKHILVAMKVLAWLSLQK